MKVTFKTGSEANYGSTNGELFFASNTKQIMLNGIKYIPKKLSELTNDSGFITSITKSMVEGVLTGNITSHTHTFASLTSKPTTLSGYNLTDAMIFIQSDASNYVGARFIDTSLATKAAKAYIEFWQGTGWFNLKAGKFITSGGTSSQFLKGDGSLDSNNYLPLCGGTMTGSIYINNTVPITYKTAESGNWIYISKLLTGSNVSGKKYEACIGWLNQDGGGGGALTLIPYAQDGAPWGGNVGLYITQNSLKFNNTTVSLDGHTHSYLPLTGGTLTDNLTCNGAITATTFNGNLNGTATNASKLSSHSVTDLVYRTIYPINATGILIETDIAAGSNTMVNVHIWGNSYSKTTPIDTYIQFYNYKDNDEIINYGCAHLGYNLGDVYAFIYNSLVHIWFNVSGTGYPTINAFVGTNEGGDISGTYNHITSLTKGSKPTSGISRERVITPKVNAFTDSNVASATKLATARTIKVGSASKSFDGSGDIEFALNSIITQNNTINVGTLNVAEQLTTDKIEVKNNLTISSGADISGLTPSMIGAAAASHTHSYLPLSGGTMSNTILVTNLNADLLDGLNSSDFVRNQNITSTSSASIDANNVWVNAVKHDYRWKNVPNNNIASLLDLSYSPDWRTQLFFQPDRTLKIYARQRYNGNTWGAWREIAFTDSNVASSSKWANARTITLTGSVKGSVSIDGSANVSLVTTTNHTHSEYLPLSGGTLNGALTVPTLTSTGGIVLGVESINGSLGIEKYNEGFIGFSDINGGINGSAPFTGISLGWGSSPETSANSVRINENTFTYKGNNVWHSGNLKLGYISSGLSRAVQKDTNGNLFIVAPSLFEQGISNNYPKNLRWSNETEGQLVYDTEIEAGNFDTVEIGIPLANGTSKGFLKSISEVTNVTGYTPCPVVSGTPYYKEDCLYLGSTEIGYTGIMEYGIQYTFNYGTKLPYLEDYTPDSIPRCVVLCFPDRSSNYRFLFWLSAFDEGDPYIARFYNSAYETWLTIDTASRQIILSYGNTWQS